MAAVVDFDKCRMSLQSAAVEPIERIEAMPVFDLNQNNLEEIPAFK
jgi:hypothetical protein